MKIIKQFFVIFLFSFLGEMLSKLVPIPGSVIGMVLLFLALHFKWVKLSQIEETGNWLVANMGLFFVPPGVGLMANFEMLKGTWWQLLILMFITTALMMIFVGRVVQRIKRKFDKKIFLKKEFKSHV
ncbi:CidA/LrgA family protein [Vagococcus silagei]|uniref:CidA/LrgA family protein n=1 Tax=Vagococcus silagei TaxID=2508885 RepID=A0A4S3B406_9ENTE|nr:CidA/LrgA family protein [Vagococcus silagei]THB60126.1 CidA/LrgA family protein [Vagococcus silagei]